VPLPIGGGDGGSTHTYIYEYRIHDIHLSVCLSILSYVCVCSVWVPCVALPSGGGSSAGPSPLCWSPVGGVSYLVCSCFLWYLFLVLPLARAYALAVRIPNPPSSNACVWRASTCWRKRRSSMRFTCPRVNPAISLISYDVCTYTYTCLCILVYN